MNSILSIIDQYEPLTAENRCRDFSIPNEIPIGSEMVKVPRSLSRKDVHYYIDNSGELIRAAWLTKPLAYCLNSQRLSNPENKVKEFNRALNELDRTISSLIKNEVLRDKRGPGAMAFAQTSEHVPPDSILISQRSFNELVSFNPKWKRAKSVMAIRFPNLGPGTTQKLNLIVNTNTKKEELSDTALFFRVPELQDLLNEFEAEEALETSGVIDAFYLNPSTLVDGMCGDCDGDTIYVVLEEFGKPQFKNIDLTRTPAPIRDSDVELMLKKSNRTSRTNLTSWLPNYFDDIPIGPATYAIRWDLKQKLNKYKDSSHPMADAWDEIAPQAIRDIEFVMDVRKGEFSEAQINAKMNSIMAKMVEINKAKERGDWFAKAVTNSSITDIVEFVKQFPTLQKFVNHITAQKEELVLNDLFTEV